MKLLLGFSLIVEKEKRPLYSSGKDKWGICVSFLRKLSFWDLCLCH